MKKPPVLKSIRLPYELWERIQILVEDGTFKDFSDSLRVLAEGGLRLLEIKDKVHDPEAVNRLSVDWSAKMNEKQILDWAYQLSDDQLKAVDMLVGLEKDRRNRV